MPDVLATIGDEQITLTDVRSRVGDELDQLQSKYEQNRFKVVDNALKEILRERVLDAEAKKQGKTIEQLVDAEMGGNVEPTELEIST